MLSRAAFDRYGRQVSNLADGAGEYVRRMVSAYLSQNPDASVAECREFAREVIADAVRIYGDAAATAAADYYDSVMGAADNGAKPALLHSGADAAQVEKVVRYQAGKLVRGDQLGFERECAAYASDASKQAANRTMLKNALRDSKIGVRFARVPTGAETCTFCRMLASRGFDYKSEKTAGKFSHFHRNCDCRIVSSADAEGLEGYDPDREYDLWKKFEEIDADKSLSRAENEAAKRAVLDGLDRHETLAGAPRGNPMPFEEADSGNVNPDYTGRHDGNYINCQTCVVAFEARLRGYDLMAMPNNPGSMSERVSYDTRLAWIDPKTGKKPEWTIGRGSNGAAATLKRLKSTLAPGERYTMQFTWKGSRRSGHIVNLDLDDSGNVRIKDNQRGFNQVYGVEERSEWVGDDAVLEYLKDVSCGKFFHVLRIDNLDFNREVVNEMLKAR